MKVNLAVFGVKSLIPTIREVEFSFCLQKNFFDTLLILDNCMKIIFSSYGIFQEVHCYIEIGKNEIVNPKQNNA